MSSLIAQRRYLTNFEPHRVPHLFTDVLVIGSGVAGLCAAIEAAHSCDVLLVTKSGCEESTTRYAQGGVAAAINPPDSPELHARDTLETACGLARNAVVELVTREGPGRIAALTAAGARFDLTGGVLAAGLEGGHSAARIIHADGDATGREISRALLDQARRTARLRMFEQCHAIDLLTHEGQVAGAVTHHPKYGHQMFWAGATVVASGGCGRIFRETTNPALATGDGMAMAFRAGATLRDMEMVQFHPTTLYVAGAARALISEAVRGEGGRLLNRAGERFMPRYDERAELAPRDVVSRGIVEEMKRERGTHVFLDVRHLPPGRFAARFPNIDRLCRDFDLDPQRDLIPVRPAAHYCVGGVAVDLDGRTSVRRLLACGEAASSGLHGANRLASNSLLEGLVLGQRTGRAAAESASAFGRIDHAYDIAHRVPHSSRTELDLQDVVHSLRSLMSRNVGIERSADRLRETLEIIEFWARYVMDKVFDDVPAWETQNMLTVAYLIALSAATRTESRGVHFRSDFAETSADWARHVDVRRADDRVDVRTSEID
ncbi:MAG: L-aspartate oxidase [Phycisphaerae bacterium]|nr:L-aspartate oxidase [Phycisphaerae bacterium]